HSRHPHAVVRLIAHEPPLLELLADAARFQAAVDDIDQTYRTEAVFAVMGKFGALVEEGGPPYSQEMQQANPESMGATEMTERMMGNLDLFVAHELKPIMQYMPDVDALRALAATLVSAAGKTSGQQAACRAAYALADQVGIDVSHLPGAHGGWGS